MGRIGEFGGQVLPGPMFVMFAIAPQPGHRQIINSTFVGAPDFVPILAITKG